MFHSFLLIDTDSDLHRVRPGRRWVQNPYRVHQRLCMAFPRRATKEADPHFLARFVPSNFCSALEGVMETHVHGGRHQKAGFLFRIDPVASSVPSRHLITVQSAIEPDWEYAFHNASEFLCARQLVRPFDPEYTAGERVYFRLHANATVKTKRLTKLEREEGMTAPDKSRRMPCSSRDEQVAWLSRKAAQGGFSLVENEHLSVVPTGIVRAYRTRDPNERPITLHGVRFDGVLNVSDPSAFLNTVGAGIGSAKGLGFGLLSLAPENA